MMLSSVNQFAELMNKLLGDKEEISLEEIKRYSAMAIQTRNILNCTVKPTEKDLEDIYIASFEK
ncbi:MAG: alcohol dehydrogenase, partial [Oscillospiraceae bacterium]|nr:alcohol dehydrogenase [Oscillospiraceae bacterium]